MPLPKLLLSPDSDGYGVVDGEESIATKLEGGASRFRLDQLGAAAAIAVKWTCNPVNYDYIRAFYRTSTKRGSQPFLIDLILDKSAVAEYTAYFTPGSFGLVEQKGLAYVVGASLEVIPNPPTETEDAATIAAGPSL